MPSGGNNSWYWDSVVFGNNTFVAVSADHNKALWSADGKTWTAVTLPSPLNDWGWETVAFGNNTFVLFGGLSDRSIRSSDGKTWTTAGTLPSTLGKLQTFMGGLFVGVYGNTKFAWSSDGNIWNTATLPSPLQNWGTIVYGNGRFVIFSGVHTRWSSGGNIWNTGGLLPFSNDSAVYVAGFGNGRFVAVSNSSPEVVWSADGETWSKGGTLPLDAKYTSYFVSAYGEP
jgi:hypothetical protein